MDTYTITIDGGTTNTRCILWNSSRQRIDEQKREVGVRNTAIDGNNSKLKNAVKECLEQLLEDHSLLSFLFSACSIKSLSLFRANVNALHTPCAFSFFTYCSHIILCSVASDRT